MAKEQPSPQQVLLALTYYFIDRGFAIREPVQQRPQTWLAPLLRGVPPEMASMLRRPTFDPAFYQAITGKKWPDLGGEGDEHTVLVHDPKHVETLLSQPLTNFTPGAKQIASMALFQPQAVSPTTDPDDFVRRRGVNEEVLQNPVRNHSEAERYLAVLRDAASRLDVGLDCLRWGAIDKLTKELALGVCWGRFDPSLQNLLDECMRLANALGLVDLLKALVAQMTPDPKEAEKRLGLLIAQFPPDIRRRCQTVMGSEVQKYQTREALHAWIGERLPQAAEGSLAAQLQQQVSDKKIKADEAPDQLCHWLFAVRGTTASLTAYALSFLAADHSLQRQLRGDLLRDHGSVASVHAALAQGERSDSLDALEQLALEAGRLYPPVPFTVRNAAEGGELPKGFPDGPNFMVHTAGNSRLEKFVGDKPAGVCPQRWAARDTDTPEIDGKGLAGATIFGGGEKRCPGMNLGLMLTSGLLAHFLLGYELQEVKQHAAHEAPMNTENTPAVFDQFGIEIRLSAIA